MALTLLRQFLDHLVEVRLEKPILHDAVFLKLALRVRPCDFRSDLAGVLRNLPVGRVR
jgi:hypothetical protein